MTGRLGLVERSGTNQIPFLLQAVSTVAFLGSLVIALVFSATLVTSLGLVVVSTALVAAATVIAYIVRLRSDADFRWVVAPLLMLFALGVFRAGTGGSESLFVALLVLPALLIASQHGVRWVFVSVVASCAAMLLPSAFELRMPVDLRSWLEALVPPLVFAGAAVVAHAFAGQARHQIESISALAEERVVMLEKAVATSAELARNSDRLLAADQFTRGVLDAVTEQSVIGTNLDGLIDVWNPGAERLLRLSPHETQGRRYVYEFHQPEELAQHAEQLGLHDGYAGLTDAARQGRAEVRDWTYRCDDGTTTPVRVAVTPRMDREGETIGFIFVATDITELLAAARLRDEFVSLISHELRTPLSSILGYLELLRDDDDDPLSDEQLSYLRVAERNAHRLLQLVGDLLFTAQVESGHLALTTHEMDVASVVAASVESAVPVAAGVGVELRVDIPATPVLVVGDPLRLGQAADNLISNAVKFTPRGGVVTVKAEVSERGAVITVTDTGVGISMQDVDRLYERFFRAATAVRNAVPGIGLGLSITKAIVEGHGGRLDVSSEEGVGTVFSITLPPPPAELTA